jgi:hypothetical protein
MTTDKFEGNLFHYFMITYLTWEVGVSLVRLPEVHVRYQNIYRITNFFNFHSGGDNIFLLLLLILKLLIPFIVTKLPTYKTKINTSNTHNKISFFTATCFGGTPPS